MIRLAALAAALTLSTVACEHPAERDDSAERRAGVDNPLRDEREGERARSMPPREAERASPGPAGPRTSTPGGAASGLHQESLSSAGTCPAEPADTPACSEPASA